MLNADKAALSDSQSIIQHINKKAQPEMKQSARPIVLAAFFIKKAKNRLVNMLVFIARWLAELSVKRTSDKVSLIVKMKDLTPFL
ncbi:hypothetical protein [Aeromonas veronii]|uniref:hypothetical protein n=1 Tax=Aeromonas veronii TaxID=654 RepID=UPI003D20433F